MPSLPDALFHLCRLGAWPARAQLEKKGATQFTNQSVVLMGRHMGTPAYLRKQRGNNLLFSFSVTENRIIFSMSR